MQSQNIMNNNPSQDESSEHTWKSAARILKLFFYIATIGVIILSFASSMGWVSILDAIIGSVAGGLTLFTAAGYSVSLRIMVFTIVMESSKAIFR